MQKILFIIVLLCAGMTMQAQNASSEKENSRPKVALVFGGGGAKGAATVGALKYVEQSGVPIDMVVGTSIGSIVGGMYAVGYRHEQLDSLFRMQQWVNMFAGSLMGDSIVNVFRDNMRGEYSQVDFDTLPTPFRAVAVDINKMRQVVLNGMQLVDGGVLNNLPVDVAREMGADYVIAVDLTVNKHENSSSLLSLLRPDLKKYNRNRKDADIYINPKLKGYGAQDFSRNKIAEMITLGEKAGKSSLKEMKKLKKRLGN